MIGGFLGAGKTTCMMRLGERLRDEGRRTGLITNDQASELVDTAWFRQRGFSTAEIAGGCFCCRFDSLTDAARQLTAETRPEFILAEPVGSCTDLVATVSYPLRRIYGDRFVVAPLSVVVDPIRAERVLGLESGSSFSEKVLYIYRKQLEEAELIVINKRELLSPERLRRLSDALQERHPKSTVFQVSAREGSGLDAWFDHLRRGEAGRWKAMPVDYDVYAEGEALLGWLNATLSVESQGASGVFDGNQLLRELAEGVRQWLASRGLEIAHCKITLESRDGLGDLGIVNVVRNDFVPELGQALPESIRAGQLTFNLRAEGDPELLAEALQSTVRARVVEASEAGLVMRVEHLERFRPGRPTPTHRMAGLED
ncbi:MAG: cobalamin biosynthesis protein P47K [Verrucomicrobia bacterium]|nr:cobalamin biosynthesis protein P47K [Verrucomicrobiota bacterium]